MEKIFLSLLGFRRNIVLMYTVVDQLARRQVETIQVPVDELDMF